MGGRIANPDDMSTSDCTTCQFVLLALWTDVSMMLEDQLEDVKLKSGQVVELLLLISYHLIWIHDRSSQICGSKPDNDVESL